MKTLSQQREEEHQKDFENAIEITDIDYVPLSRIKRLYGANRGIRRHARSCTKTKIIKYVKIALTVLFLYLVFRVSIGMTYKYGVAMNGSQAYQNNLAERCTKYD